MLDYNKKELAKIRKIVIEIRNKEIEYTNLNQSEIIELVNNWKNDFEDNQNLMIDAFALCIEVTKRVLDKRQYDVQIVGGVVLSQGRIAEMKTGEGKTLTELCPTFYNALSNKGVHILTVNDYLCERDFFEMKQVFEYMGMSVGLVISTTSIEERKKAYLKDITYTTNTEIGFDYLRDNTATTIEMQVLRGLNYAILDELDSILIDDARTPLILAKEEYMDNYLYTILTNLLKTIKEEFVEYDKKDNYVLLTEDGVSWVEKSLGIENLAAEVNAELRHILYQCLRAKYLFYIDKDYIVSDEEIKLIDTNTGRIAEGRKLSDGLHQAIEAKENMKLTTDNISTASITYQSFFSLYNKLSGMSGTIATERKEIEDFYNLDIICIPTNKPIKRIDEQDRIYVNKEDKYKAILFDAIEHTNKGIPVLIGTTSIKESEILSSMLMKKEIKHNLLNAKTKAEEVNIIASAGKKGNLTIATNIAGRGTDIKISQDVNDLGGLRVIGTERNLARRIDNQLIGRSGRQGNNGSSVFYLSKDDTLFTEYTSEETRNKAEKLKGAKLLNFIKKFIYKAQAITEDQGYSARKDVLERDWVIAKQRNIIYEQRQLILECKEQVGINLSRMILECVKMQLDNAQEVSDALVSLKSIFNIKMPKIDLDIEDDNEEIINILCEHIISYYNSIVIQIDNPTEEILKNILLAIIDREWASNIEAIERVKKDSGYQGLLQRDPFTMYKLEASKTFHNTINRIREGFIYEIFNILLPQLGGKI